MRFGLVGVGKWGQTYLRTIQEIEGAKIVATCSRHISSEIPKELRAERHYQSVFDMITSVKMDTIIIASHPDSHMEIAHEALIRDINVVCEKPCMFSSEEFNRILSLQQGGSIFFTNYTNIYHKIIDKMQDVLSVYDAKPILKLVNCGNGPFREGYSDIWDYGSHVASVIYHLFPHSYFQISSYEHTEEGNHSIILNGPNASIEAIFGNKSQNRLHSFEMLGGSHSAYWFNDRTENPLKTMLVKFSRGEINSNLELSQRISSLLTDIERLNKRAKIVS